MLSAQPSLDLLKQELSRLSTYTKEIGKAQEVATQAQAAANAVIEAAENISLENSLLLDELKTEHLRTISEQTVILQTASHQQAADAQDIIRQEVSGLRQGAETAAKVLQQVLEEQPHILATITAQYKQEGSSQTDLVRQRIGESTAFLSEQVAAQIGKLDQVKKDFDVAVRKQLDVLTSITDRLQVISGSLTAFRDAMNAARFTDRLEELDSKQERLVILTAQNHTSLLSRLEVLESIQQHGTEMNTTLAALKSQNLLLQAVIAIGIVALLALHFIK
ncbi:hypothetical protein [Hymenobacter bucti]|uniref:Methyl-accepting chemotaxis protein n=1 Tax=Hymenobacter bucti TaxID=1844114 RepID=A0ABW4QXK8_9BACT